MQSLTTSSPHTPTHSLPLSLFLFSAFLTTLSPPSFAQTFLPNDVPSNDECETGQPTSPRSQQQQQQQRQQPLLSIASVKADVDQQQQTSAQQSAAPVKMQTAPLQHQFQEVTTHSSSTETHVNQHLHDVATDMRVAPTSLVPMEAGKQSVTRQSQPFSALHVCQNVYPAALATHEEVVADPRLFLDTLEKFHAALGMKTIIPKVGGKDLDLHILYREVTSCGGLKVVIKDRKWRQITVALDFPPTITNASYVLRKYYIILLHHFEQVYFFRAHGQIIPPPATLSISRPVVSQLTDPDVNSKRSGGVDYGIRRITDSAQALGVDPASSIGSVVTGAIDGKFDNGYLVTVMVGARKMRGVLYHVPSTNSEPQNASVPALILNIGSDLKSSDIGPKLGQKRKRKDLSKKDPNAPRQNKTGYNYFFAEQHAKLKTHKPDKERLISRMIGDLWNKLTEEEKSPYQEQGMKDRERYRREMMEYRQRLKSQLTCERNNKGEQAGTNSLAVYQGVGATNQHCYLNSDVAMDANKSTRPRVQGLDDAGGSESLLHVDVDTQSVPVGK